MVGGSDLDSSGAAPYRGVPGRTYRLGLYIPADPGAPQGPTGGASKCCWLEGGLEDPAKPAAAMTPPQMGGGQWKAGWSLQLY